MKKRITVEGMSCSHCVNHIMNALKELNGVIKAEVDLTAKTANIEASGDINDLDIKLAIEDAGYEVTEIEILS